MKIISNTELGTLTLIPVETGEESVISSICDVLKPEDEMQYDGREDNDDGKVCAVTFRIKSEKKEEVGTRGNVTFRRNVFVGGITLILRGSTDEDKCEVPRIRDACFFSSCGFIFIGETNIDGKRAIITTVSRCKHCGANMIRRRECEHKTCDACAAKCEHHYIRGLVHGNVDVGVGEYCSKCGRGKPRAEGEREKTRIEQHLAAGRELGMQIFYDDGPPFTPEQAVEYERLARRYRRSKQRNQTQ